MLGTSLRNPGPPPRYVLREAVVLPGERVCMAQTTVWERVSLIKGLLSFRDTCPDTWLDWDKLIPAITTPAAVSSGEQELTQIRHRRRRGRHESAKEVAQSAYELYIYKKSERMTEERQGWVEVVQSHSMSQRVFLFFSSSRLLTSAVRQPVAQSDTLCS